MKKFILFMLFIAAMSFYSISAVAADVTFSDVDANSESGAAIMKMAAKGFVNGYGDGTFKPDQTITRAELVKIVNLVFDYQFEGDSIKGFPDVKGDEWFAGQLFIAQSHSYIGGFEDGSFRPDQNLTRQQMCKILNVTLKLVALPIPTSIKDDVSPWAQDYVTAVVTNGIMPIESGGLFRATQNITRAEVCAALAKFIVEIPVDSGSGSGTGSGSGSGTGSGSGSGTGSGDSGSGTTDLSADDNAVKAITTAIPKLKSIQVTDKLKSTLDLVIHCMELALQDSKTHLITEEYLRTTYAADLKIAFKAWNALSATERNDLENMVATVLSAREMVILDDYFLADE